jgi:hypothetical protein
VFPQDACDEALPSPAAIENLCRMGRTLSDEDVGAIAQQVVQLLAKRLADSAQSPAAPPPTPPPKTEKALPQKLAFSLKELSVELGISKVSIYRLEQRGLLKSLPYLRTKVYTRREVERFLDAGWIRPR